MEFCIVQLMGSTPTQSPPLNVKDRQELFYIRAFPKLHPMSSTYLGELCPLTAPLTQVPMLFNIYIIVIESAFSNNNNYKK